MIGNSNSIYGKYLYDNLMKRNHSKAELLRNICIFFNCESATALEIMRLIPDVALNTILDDLRNIPDEKLKKMPPDDLKKIYENEKN